MGPLNDNNILQEDKNKKKFNKFFKTLKTNILNFKTISYKLTVLNQLFHSSEMLIRHLSN